LPRDNATFWVEGSGSGRGWGCPPNPSTSTSTMLKLRGCQVRSGLVQWAKTSTKLKLSDVAVGHVLAARQRYVLGGFRVTCVFVCVCACVCMCVCVCVCVCAHTRCCSRPRPCRATTLGSRVKGLGLGVWDLEIKVEGIRPCRATTLRCGCSVQGLGFRVWNLGFSV